MMENNVEPNWIDAPTRHYFWAINENGEAYWYEQEPTYNGFVWINEQDCSKVFDRRVANYQQENAKYSLRKNPNTPKHPKFKVGDLVKVNGDDKIKVVSMSNVFGYLDVGVRSVADKYSPSIMYQSECVELLKSVNDRFNFNIGDKVYVFGSGEIHTIVATLPPHHVLLSGMTDCVGMEMLTLANDYSYNMLTHLFENIVFTPNNT